MLNVLGHQVDWPQKFLVILSQNGILLPSGENCRFSDIKLASDASKTLKNTGFFSLQGKIGERSVRLLVSPNSSQINEEYILEQFLSPPSKSPFDESENVILCAAHFSGSFISALIESNSFPKRVSLALIHPDLIIDGLTIHNHAASIRLCGYLQISSPSSLIQPQYIDPQTHSAINFPRDKITIWGEIGGKSSNKAEFFQIPFYSPFLAKDLQGIIDSPLVKLYVNEPPFSFGVNAYGIPFFSL